MWTIALIVAFLVIAAVNRWYARAASPADREIDRDEARYW